MSRLIDNKYETKSHARIYNRQQESMVIVQRSKFMGKPTNIWLLKIEDYLLSSSFSGIRCWSCQFKNKLTRCFVDLKSNVNLCFLLPLAGGFWDLLLVCSLVFALELGLEPVLLGGWRTQEGMVEAFGRPSLACCWWKTSAHAEGQGSGFLRLHNEEGGARHVG